MERRDVLKGLTAGMGALLGGLGVKQAVTAAEEPPAPAGPGGPPGVCGSIGPVGRDGSTGGRDDDGAADSDQLLVAGCVAELLVCAESWQARKPHTVEVPFAKKPYNLHVRGDSYEGPTDNLQKLLLILVAQRQDVRFFQLLNERVLPRVWEFLRQGAKRTVVSYMVRRDDNLGPQRIGSHKYVCDVCELTGTRLAVLLADPLAAVAHDIELFPRKELAAYGPEEMPDVLRLETPLRIEASRDGTYFQFYAYAEVYATGLASDNIPLLRQVVPDLTETGIASAPLLTAAELQPSVEELRVAHYPHRAQRAEPAPQALTTSQERAALLMQLRLATKQADALSSLVSKGVG